MGYKRIITVTLNPSLDRTIFTHYLAVGYHNTLTETTRLDSGGRGVHISRALHKLGFTTEAVILLGNDAIGAAYRALLDTADFPVHFVRCDGQTRSNTIILDTGQQNETQLIEESEAKDADSLREIEQLLKQHVTADDIVVFGGTLPHGLPTDTYARLIQTVKNVGAAVALLTHGEPLSLALEQKPDIVLVGQRELETLFNYPVRTPQDVIYTCGKLSERGVGMLIVMQDEDNEPILIKGQRAWMAHFSGQVLRESTTSGLYSAMMAGFLMAYAQDKTLPEALELGTADAIYTRSQIGPEFGTLDEIATHIEEVDVQEVNHTPKETSNA